MTEEWRPVTGCDGYEVSDLGRVRSFMKGSWRLRALCGERYLHVILRVEGESVIRYVHGMVAEAFLGPRPAGHDINHRDCNRLNNVPANLEYVTHRENMVHAVRMGRPVGKRKLSTELYARRRLLARDMRGYGWTYAFIGRLLGMTPDGARETCIR